MRLGYASEMRMFDKRADQEIGIPLLVLMENAGRAIADKAAQMLGGVAGKRIVIFAGRGNNGGDGFAAARLLACEDARVEVYTVAALRDLNSDTTSLQLQICKRSQVDVTYLGEESVWSVAERHTERAALIIDALLGTNFRGELDPIHRRVCRLINSVDTPVLSIDLPSGVSADNGCADVDAVCADATVTMVLPKPGLYLYPGGGLTGEISVAAIGVPDNVVDDPANEKFLLMADVARALVPVRAGDCYKGDAGRIIVVAGSPGFIGAAALCATAALRSGAGLVSLYTPQAAQEPLAIKLTEVMVQGLPELRRGVIGSEALECLLPVTNAADVLAIGPGLGTSPETCEQVRELLLKAQVPVVIDADALTALVGHTEILNQMQVEKVLTPHPGEMARLIGLSAPEVNERRIELAIKYAAEWNAVLVLKGAPTIVGCPDGAMYVNASGNCAMATAGCGDVLTGVIAGFIAQGVPPQEAALAGVYLHGAAGDLAADNKGIGIMAGDLLEYLPRARKELQK